MVTAGGHVEPVGAIDRLVQPRQQRRSWGAVESSSAVAAGGPAPVDHAAHANGPPRFHIPQRRAPPGSAHRCGRVRGALGSGHACGDDPRARRSRGARLGRGRPTRCAARARCSSTSPPPRSTAPTCCSGRASTRRRPARREYPRAGVQRASISEVGDGVTGWSVGDEVCALLAGGGYAERVAVPAGQLLPGPAGVDLVTAAALPEVTCTVWSNVFMLAGLRRGERFLVHGGSSGIGTMAIQLAARAGAPVFTTAGTGGQARLLPRARRRRRDQLPRRGLRRAGRRPRPTARGVDVILDNMGAKYLARNVAALAVGGRLVMHRHAGRHARPSSTSARCMTKRGVGARDDAARPAGRPATAARPRSSPPSAHDVWPRRRARRRPPDRRPAAADVAAPPRRTGWSRPASTSARCCSSPRTDRVSSSRTRQVEPSVRPGRRAAVGRGRPPSSRANVPPAGRSDAVHAPAWCRVPSPVDGDEPAVSRPARPPGDGRRRARVPWASRRRSRSRAPRRRRPYARSPAAGGPDGARRRRARRPPPRRPAPAAGGPPPRRAAAAAAAAATRANSPGDG